MSETKGVKYCYGCNDEGQGHAYWFFPTLRPSNELDDAIPRVEEEGEEANRCADSVRPEHGQYAEGSPYASGEHNVAFRMPA